MGNVYAWSTALKPHVGKGGNVFQSYTLRAYISNVHPETNLRYSSEKLTVESCLYPFIGKIELQLIAVLIILFCINPILAIYSFLTIPVFFFTYRFLLRMFQKLHIRNFIKAISFSSYISDIITGMRVVKAFSTKIYDVMNISSYKRP